MCVLNLDCLISIQSGSGSKDLLTFTSLFSFSLSADLRFPDCQPYAVLSHGIPHLISNALLDVICHGLFRVRLHFPISQLYVKTQMKMPTW